MRVVRSILSIDPRTNTESRAGPDMPDPRRPNLVSHRPDTAVGCAVMRTMHTGPILIADITGYSRYLNESELVHAEQTLSACSPRAS